MVVGISYACQRSVSLAGKTRVQQQEVRRKDCTDNRQQAIVTVTRVV